MASEAEQCDESGQFERAARIRSALVRGEALREANKEAAKLMQTANRKIITAARKATTKAKRTEKAVMIEGSENNGYHARNSVLPEFTHDINTVAVYGYNSQTWATGNPDYPYVTTEISHETHVFRADGTRITCGEFAQMESDYMDWIDSECEGMEPTDPDNLPSKIIRVTRYIAHQHPTDIKRTAIPKTSKAPSRVISEQPKHRFAEAEATELSREFVWKDDFQGAKDWTDNLSKRTT